MSYPLFPDESFDPVKTLAIREIRIPTKVAQDLTFRDEGLLKLWMLCLLSTYNEPTLVHVEGLTEPVRVERGQFITSRYALYLGFYARKQMGSKSALTLWRRLKTLESLGYLQMATNVRYTLITVCHYEKYCISDATPTENSSTNIAKPVAKSRTPSPAKHFVPPSTEEVARYCRERKNGVDPEKFVDFYSAKGWMIGKNKMQDWRAAVRNWEKSQKENARQKPMPPENEERRVRYF